MKIMSSQQLRELFEKLPPRPWVVHEERYYWIVRDSKGDVVFDDGSAGGEYNAQCSKVTRDWIVAVSNAAVLQGFEES